MTRKGHNLFYPIITMIGIILIFWFGPDFFGKLDCAEARKQLVRLEACEAHSSCKLTSVELSRYAAYLKLEIKACPEIKQ